jgi:hypothetical protein
MSVIIPVAETVKLSELKTDSENPNKMSKERALRQIQSPLYYRGKHKTLNIFLRSGISDKTIPHLA